MKRRALILLLSVLALCLILTLIHLLYLFYAYGHCSILYFVGKEVW